MTVRHIEGDATWPGGKGPKIVAHICNDVGGWGAGFVLALSARWSEPEREYLRWWEQREANDFGLGGVQLVKVDEDVWVANMVAQHGIVAGTEGPPIRYQALEECLKIVADYAIKLQASVHMPRIGAGLAGGDWTEIETIIHRTLDTRLVPTTIYNYSHQPGTSNQE